MWKFELVWILNAFLSIPVFVGEYRLISLVSGEKSKKNYSWLLYGLMIFLVGFILTAASFSQLVEQNYVDVDFIFLLADAVTTIMRVIFHAYIFQNVAKKNIYFLVLFSGVFYQIVTTFHYFIIGFLPIEVNFASTNFLLYISESVFETIVLLFVYSFFSKTKILQVFQQIFYHPKWTMLITVIITIMYYFIEFLIPKIVHVRGVVLILIYTASYFVYFIAFLILLREYLRDQRLRDSEALNLQQTAYLQKLETIQQDLRKVQHDYKNVALGAYAKVEAGDMTAAQEYIATQMLQVDDKLQLNIQQINQLINVQVVELKTLIMTKIMEAEKQDVVLSVEVLEPVNQIPMEIVDLLRCGGIILDNAIEAAAKEENKQVTVLLLKENDRLTFVVKNSSTYNLDMQRIWTEGYSTKGGNRGLGLANLREILGRYPNVVLETRREEKNFIQVLVFQL
ncbi:two-component system sensor histidine kinase AgrC [Enterococcus sp. PF1-24]|uniref:sensor histidine kinase n=1 Tax=unclassified Enterococcus TaxID=2608891 RepID=UPI002476A8F5|nr:MULTISPECIES: GHKL domain-containing protein [unclassified Enterococcus]MDH6363735.1 two-component system sensor histidine kinase AgrC [Enterococcus sp. PFB1-1]MDH6400691.1 two-component system sensor histidine kinase AgrC [Enterococcus sp. PF1-24]